MRCDCREPEATGSLCGAAGHEACERCGKCNGWIVSDPSLTHVVHDDEEAAELQVEISDHFKRILVRALAVAYDALPVVALDQPGVILQAARENDKRPAYLVLGVPDEIVKNQTGDPEQRDLILLVHVTRSLQRKIEGAEKAIIASPN